MGNRLKLSCGLIIAATALLAETPHTVTLETSQLTSGIACGLPRPMVVYNNWSAYDELSDTIPQTRELCMRLLDEVIEKKKSGVQIDCYLMDAFWFDLDGGYRVWHKFHWPDGPGEWIGKCRDNGIMPGLWFSTNLIMSGGAPMLNPVVEWNGSIDSGSAVASLSEGGYLSHLMETLQQYADMGIGLFKFDFAYFDASIRQTRENFLPEDIIENNKRAFIAAMKQFRQRNPDIIIIAYNGFGGEMDNTVHPFRKTVDPRWLEIFDTMYSGDPRPSDLPMSNFWRSQDLYSDQMVREMAFNGIPVSRIDNCSFMTGTTGTCYNRGKAAWKSSLLLNMARGGWLNVWHGNIDLFDNNDARWIAQAQKLYLNLQQYGVTTFIGGLPGQGEPYGYLSRDTSGGLYTIVNPAQQVITITLPAIDSTSDSRILFTDAGFVPSLSGNTITLGPEQMAVVGFGPYADLSYNLGIENDITIPHSITPISLPAPVIDRNSVSYQFYPTGNSIRITMRQLDNNGIPFRSWGGGLPNGESMDKYFSITASQNNRPVPVDVNHNKVLWCGLSWGAGEIDTTILNPDEPITVTCTARDVSGDAIDVNIFSIIE